MADITVPVPDERTAEFYQFFGLWLGGSMNLSGAAVKSTSGVPADPPAPTKNEWGTTDQDYADAELLWKKFSTAARTMFGLLIDNAGKEYTGEQIAKECGIPNGAHGVAGVLAWPGRHGAKIGRGLPCESREDSEAQGGGFYWMPADRAEVFKAAREKVGGNA